MTQRIPTASVLFALFIAGCHLDTSNNVGCKNSDDCLDGYECLDRICRVRDAGGVSNASGGSGGGGGGDAGVNATCISPGDCPDGFTCYGTVCIPSTFVDPFVDPAPDNLGVNPLDTAGDYEFTWTNHAGNAAVFEVEMSSESGFDLIGTTAAGATRFTTTFCRSGNYTFRVCVLTDTTSSECAMVNGVSVSPAAQRPVPKPQVTYRFDSEQVTLTWSPVNFNSREGEVCGYRIYQRFDSSGPWGAPEKVLPKSATTYTDETGGMESQYAVAAYCGGCESELWSCQEQLNETCVEQ